MKKLIAICAMAAGMAFAQTTTSTTTTATPAPGQGLKARLQKGLIKALDLTDAQKQQAKTILQATKQQAQPLAQQLKAGRQALSEAVQAGDTARIQQVAAEVGNLQGQVLAIRSAGMAKFLAILTPDQKAKAIEFRQKVQQVLGARG